jgi:hypothetical protein
MEYIVAGKVNELGFGSKTKTRRAAELRGDALCYLPSGVRTPHSLFFT